jgi:hypothetical protein
MMMLLPSELYSGLYKKQKTKNSVCSTLSRGCFVVLGDGWSACLLYYDDACGMHASPFPLIASAFGGFQVFYTNCGGLWHRTRADRSAFVRFTHTHTHEIPVHQALLHGMHACSS